MPNKNEWEQFFSKAQVPPTNGPGVSAVPTATTNVAPAIKPAAAQITPSQQQQLLAMLQSINASQVARVANPVVPTPAPVAAINPPLDVKQMLVNTLNTQPAGANPNLTAALAQQLLSQGKQHFEFF